MKSLPKLSFLPLLALVLSQPQAFKLKDMDAKPLVGSCRCHHRQYPPCSITHSFPSISVAEIACSNDDFSTLCSAVTVAGLGETLSGGSWTVFAPTNAAFDTLGDDFILALGNDDL